MDFVLFLRHLNIDIPVKDLLIIAPKAIVNRVVTGLIIKVGLAPLNEFTPTHLIEGQLHSLLLFPLFINLSAA